MRERDRLERDGGGALERGRGCNDQGITHRHLGRRWRVPVPGRGRQYSLAPAAPPPAVGSSRRLCKRRRPAARPMPGLTARAPPAGVHAFRRRRQWGELPRGPMCPYVRRLGACTRVVVLRCKRRRRIDCEASMQKSAEGQETMQETVSFEFGGHHSAPLKQSDSL